MPRVQAVQLRALSRFCETLGLDPEAARETEPDYVLISTVSSALARCLSADDLAPLVDAFGSALTLSIKQQHLVQLEIPWPTGSSLEQEIQRLSTLDSTEPADIELKLAKTALLRNAGVEQAPCRVKLYLFADRLRQAVDISLIALDETVFGDPYTPVLLVALEGNLHYVGQCVTIVSLKDLDQLPAAVKSVQPVHNSLRRRIDRYLEAARDLNRAGYELKHITPIHVLGRAGGAASGELCAIMRRHLCHLCILYSATRSVRVGSTFQVDYAGSDETVTIELTSKPLSVARDATLAQLALWLYGGATGDRATVLQNVAARQVRALQPATGYDDFVDRLDRILTDARWQHRVLVGQRIDKHFEQIQKLAEYVTAMSANLSAAVDATTKAVVETLLAAIAVVVAALIAGLVKHEIQSAVFDLGMRVYAGYVVLQALVRLGSLLHGYLVRESDLWDQQRLYQPVLGETWVKKLISPLSRHRRHFWVWFAVAALFYLALAAGTWSGASYIPGYLTTHGFVSPIPSPTPTPMP